MLDTRARKHFDGLFDKLAKRLLRLGLRPSHIPVFALGAGLCSAAALYFELPIVAALLLWLSGLADAVDGSMARMAKTSSLAGAMFDIVSDRIVELGVLWALALRHPQSLYAMLGLCSAILISMTVFLTTGMLAKPRGKKSFTYQAGLMERTEGFIAFTAMMLLQKWLVPLTWLFAALIGLTIVQRLVGAARLLKQAGDGTEEKKQ